MKIKDTKLNRKLKDNLLALGYSDLTEIQEKTIDEILANKNVFAISQTGSGKTGAFLIPLIQKISEDRKIRALVMAPTRDLVDQIFTNNVNYAKTIGIKTIKLVGGVSYDMQIKYLQDGSHFVIGTPGRIIDLYKRKALDLETINYLVLDEADQMLDLGFINDMKFIVSKMPNRIQTSFFTATTNDRINKLANEFLGNDYSFIRVKNKLDIRDMIDQKIYITTYGHKLNLLLDILGDSKRTLQQCIIFTRTKKEATAITKFLKFNKFNVDEIHSDRSQSSRTRILRNFRENKLQILVATNVAARGIDISNLPLVINFDIPEQKEIYVHRIGRTARAGKSGEAITFCTPKEKYEIKELEKIVKMKIKVIEEDKYTKKSDNEKFLFTKNEHQSRKKPTKNTKKTPKDNMYRKEKKSNFSKKGTKHKK